MDFGINVTLPYLEAYIEEHGDSAYHLLLDTLETNLLDEFRKMMAGEEDDKDAVERAAKIVEAANSVIGSTKPGGMTPDTP
ncbi:MAG: hypothetical protein HY306_06790 [Nitrosomonadales bacterium]|nr:hypothetical protein [Nitrosomonadales bacterium]